MAAESNNLEEILKPFYQRASEAEDRLARLEASVAKNKEYGNDEQLKLVTELQSELENAKAEQVAEREKAMKEVQHLTTENAKLQYRIIHLVRALKETRFEIDRVTRGRHRSQDCQTRFEIDQVARACHRSLDEVAVGRQDRLLQVAKSGRQVRLLQVPKPGLSQVARTSR
ncbi:hypothetical protein PHJA_001238600 [Phtheirospermum japonicum]|uniref:Uncharacterized protein n=1 Tax=Phtheirospermum japonicum TaxID=374723 RepID=A0A830BW13_9LAMI|nr:hypothetical protein PHJA_001238600 [Phtheirospermum japonicum]